MSKRKTTTFDFGKGSIDDSVISDVESSADEVVVAGGTARSRFERILHQPIRAEGGVNWDKVGAMSGVVGVAVAVVFGLIQVI